MPSISSLFPSKWLRASDLNGRTITVTMSHVASEDVSGNGEPQPVLYFEGKEKGMCLNKTNANKIAEIFGDDYSNWAGSQIVLYEAMVQFRDKMVPAIRVRGTPHTAQPRMQPQPKTSAEIIDDDIPF
jgi:hypothetical protein